MYGDIHTYKCMCRYLYMYIYIYNTTANDKYYYI